MKHTNRARLWVNAGMSLVLMMVGIVMVIHAASQLTANTATMDTAQHDYSGATRIDPPRNMPDFTLTNQRGETVSLSDLRGQPALLFFGFTHCPDFCPTTISDFKTIQRELGEKGNRISFVFISVDGNRDTPEVMADFFRVRDVNAAFIGLTGSPDDVRRIAVDYDVIFEYEEKDASGNYAISHTPALFLLDKAGSWIMRYDWGTEISLIVADLEKII